MGVVWFQLVGGARLNYKKLQAMPVPSPRGVRRFTFFLRDQRILDHHFAASGEREKVQPQSRFRDFLHSPRLAYLALSITLNRSRCTLSWC